MNTIKTEFLSDNIFLITLNRPKKLNILNNEIMQELTNLIPEIRQNNKIKGVIITGQDKSFCAGADIKQLADLNSRTGYDFARKGQMTFRRLECLPIPVISAVNGYAFGGGCELALSAHFRIASENAQFALPESTLGIIPGYGGTQRLARLIGKGRALEICLTGRRLNATEALNWGLVNLVANQDELIEKSQQFLEKIINMAPLAIKSILKVVDHGYDLSLSDALEFEASHFALTCSSKDKIEGINAFLEKRKANFCNE